MFSIIYTSKEPNHGSREFKQCSNMRRMNWKTPGKGKQTKKDADATSEAPLMLPSSLVLGPPPPQECKVISGYRGRNVGDTGRRDSRDGEG